MIKKCCLFFPVVLMLSGCFSSRKFQIAPNLPPIKIYFKQNSSDLSDFTDSQERLNTLAKTLKENPFHSMIKVKGYCNQEEIKNIEKDGDVCNSRANAIKGYLERQSVSEKQIEIQHYDDKLEEARGTYAIINTWMR